MQKNNSNYAELRWKSLNQNQASTLKCRHSVKPLKMVSRAVGLSVFCFTGAAVTGKVLHTYGKF